jgi:hypothetical protein
MAMISSDRVKLFKGLYSDPKLLDFGSQIGDCCRFAPNTTEQPGIYKFMCVNIFCSHDSKTSTMISPQFALKKETNPIFFIA